MAEIDLRIKFDKKTILVSIGVVLLCLVMILLYRTTTDSNATKTQIPTDELKKSDFDVYAPATPPPGFSFDPQSVSGNREAFVYSYTYDTNKKLVVTTQKQPSDFDTAKFNPDKEIQTNIGRAYVVDLEARTTAAVITGESLIFINAPQQISVDRLQQFIDSLRLTK